MKINRKFLCGSSPLILILLLCASVSQGQDDENQTLLCSSKTVFNDVKVPEFKSKNFLSGTLVAGKKVKIETTEELEKKYRTTFNSLRSIVSAAGKQHGKSLPVEVKVLPLPALEAIQGPLPNAFQTNHEAYLLRIGRDGARVLATDPAGLIHGLASLEYLLINHEGELPLGHIMDWPDIPVRGIQLGLRGVTSTAAKGAIDRIRRAHYNLIVLELGNNVQFPAISKIANNCAWPVEEFADLVEYARESGLEVVPALRLLTHQHKEFLVTGAYPELMYNPKTYDPRKEEVYKIIFAYIDQLADLINPGAIHIGHDEAYGVSGRFAGAADALPPELFEYNVIKVHDYLKGKNIRTWMWGDMLIYPEEFPDMHPGSLNGTSEYAAIRKNIPKDIVICDWHYRDESEDKDKVLEFPSLEMFAKEGFEVIGATFRHNHVTKAFAKYTAGLDHPNVKGMMATTWFFFRKGAQDTSNSDNWESFDEVLEVSSEAHWNAKGH